MSSAASGEQLLPGSGDHSSGAEGTGRNHQADLDVQNEDFEPDHILKVLWLSLRLDAKIPKHHRTSHKGRPSFSSCVIMLPWQSSLYDPNLYLITLEVM